MEGAFTFRSQGRVRTQTTLTSAAFAAEVIAQRVPWTQGRMNWEC